MSYLEIQQFRYRDILEFELSIPKELDGIQVPKLSIQPLAENALYHGIKNRRGKGKITITGREEADAIVLTVSDNGQGMTPERLHEVQESIRTGERARIRACGSCGTYCFVLRTGLRNDDFF